MTDHSDGAPVRMPGEFDEQVGVATAWCERVHYDNRGPGIEGLSHDFGRLTRADQGGSSG